MGSNFQIAHLQAPGVLFLQGGEVELEPCQQVPAKGLVFWLDPEKHLALVHAQGQRGHMADIRQCVHHQISSGGNGGTDNVLARLSIFCIPIAELLQRIYFDFTSFRVVSPERRCNSYKKKMTVQLYS